MNISQEVDLSPNHIEFSEDPKTTACLKYTLHLLMVLLLTNWKSHLPCLYHLTLVAPGFFGLMKPRGGGGAHCAPPA